MAASRRHFLAAEHQVIGPRDLSVSLNGTSTNAKIVSRTALDRPRFPMRVTREFSDPTVVQQLEKVPEAELALRLSMPVNETRLQALQALEELQEDAQALGLDEMTMDEIDEIVAEVRVEHRQTETA